MALHRFRTQWGFEENITDGDAARLVIASLLLLPEKDIARVRAHLQDEFGTPPSIAGQLTSEEVRGTLFADLLLGKPSVADLIEIAKLATPSAEKLSGCTQLNTFRSAVNIDTKMPLADVWPIAVAASLAATEMCGIKALELSNVFVDLDVVRGLAEFRSGNSTVGLAIF